MTIDEAKEELDQLKQYCETRVWPHSVKALELGIEALKFYKLLKDNGAMPSNRFLPGETEE